MITKEFREWVENIKEHVENILENLADVELEEYNVGEYSLIIYITVKSNKLKTYMAFAQLEYDKNSEEQRVKLVNTRCNDMAWSIGCEIDELKKVIKALQEGEQK